jgi:hypothetical protein
MDIVDEAQEMYDREQWLATCKRWLVPGISLLVSIVIATAIGVWWKDHQQVQRRVEGDALYAALQTLQHSEDRQTSINALTDLASQGEVIAHLSLLYKAALLARTGQATEAVATYRMLAENKQVNPVLLVLAQLRLCELMIIQELGEPQELRQALHAIASRSDHPWVNQARELQGLQAFRDQAYEEAFERFDAIAHDKTASYEMRQRGRVLREATLIRAPHLRDIPTVVETDEMNHAPSN